jgi:hypothetical protein
MTAERWIFVVIVAVLLVVVAARHNGAVLAEVRDLVLLRNWQEKSPSGFFKKLARGISELSILAVLASAVVLVLHLAETGSFWLSLLVSYASAVALTGSYAVKRNARRHGKKLWFARNKEFLTLLRISLLLYIWVSLLD